MKTPLTVIAVWLFSAMQAHSAPAVTGDAQSGVPLNVAKRLEAKSALVAAGADSNVSGIPMNRAKRMAEAAREAPPVTGELANVQLSGVPLVVAKRR